MSEQACVYTPQPADVESAQLNFRRWQEVKALAETKWKNEAQFKAAVLAVADAAIKELKEKVQ